MRRALATMEVALGTRLNSSPAVVCVSADPWFRIRCGAAKLRFEMVKVRSTVEGYDELLTSMPAGEPVVIQIEKETRFFFAECRKWCGLGLPFSHLWGPKGACDSCGFLHMLQEALRSNGERDSQMAAGNAGGKRSEHENQDHGAMETPINCEIEEQRTPELLWTAAAMGATTISTTATSGWHRQRASMPQAVGLRLRLWITEPLRTSLPCWSCPTALLVGLIALCVGRGPENLQQLTNSQGGGPIWIGAPPMACPEHRNARWAIGPHGCHIHL